MYGTCDKVRVFRVYFQLSDSEVFDEQIECVDFVPKPIYHSQLTTSISTGTQYESFDSLWKHVKAHFACNKQRHFLSAQTLTIDMNGTLFSFYCSSLSE